MVKKEQNIPEMNVSNNYSSEKVGFEEISKKEIEKTNKIKEELEDFKNFVIKKFPFTLSIGILPPKSIDIFIEEEIGENLPKEEFEKIKNKTHLFMIVPEEKVKEIPKIKLELLKNIKEKKKNVWIYIKTPIDVWETGLDSKFDLMGAISMSFPLHDKGFLQPLRVAEIHKSLVLQRFEKFVVSYVIGGSWVTGTALKTSDVDAFIIINDTDVKKMPRLELKERLRSIIYQYVSEAHALAGVKKNLIHVQIYLLTEFWECVKDAHPTIFTFIRDGVPIYDRGTFTPWKVLLKMGKLKPSPESIDMFMSMGDRTVKRAKNALMEILIHDIYFGVITPSQALLMLYGLPPPNPKQTVKEMRNIFVEKEKMLEARYVNILERILKYYKDYEHEKLKEIKGEKIDKLIKDTEDYLERIKELRKQIEKRAEARTIEQIYEDTFNLLKNVTGKKIQNSMISDFEKLVKNGKFNPQHIKTLKDIINTKSDCKKGKTDLHKIDNVRKKSSSLINDLIEYSQRKDLISLEKKRISLKYEGGKKSAELLLGENDSGENKIFLFLQGSIKEISRGKIIDSNEEEVSKMMSSTNKEKSTKINPNVFELLKKELGEFEIVF